MAAKTHRKISIVGGGSTGISVATQRFPIVNTQRPRRDIWHLEKNGLAFMFWNPMLKGKA